MRSAAAVDVTGSDPDPLGQAAVEPASVNESEGSPKTGGTQDRMRLGVQVFFALLGGGLTAAERRRKPLRRK